MKRGLIARMLPDEVFDARLERVRLALAERDLPALLVYTDVWRSNQGRFVTNFMPYWNRSLIVIPREDKPVLLCGLSPRVYPWIKSVTILEDIRPASKLVATLEQLCVERGWSKLGVLDLPKLPMEIHSGLGKFEIVDVPSNGITDPDEEEFSTRRVAISQARIILEHWLGRVPENIGELEREYRRGAAEDVVIRVKRREDGAYSVRVALELGGHWVKVTRATGPAEELAALREKFHEMLATGAGYRENLAGPQPYEPGTGRIFFLQVEHNGLYRGDTCASGEHPL